jgi:hypothetical protein
LLAREEKLAWQNIMRNSRKKIRAICKLLTLFYILGLTFGLILHDENINMVKGHDIRFQIHLESLTINHELISFHIHDGNYSGGEYRMNNIRCIPLALQFPLSESFKSLIIEEDLISLLKLVLLKSFVVPSLDSLFVYAFIFVSFQPHLL